MYTDFEYAGRRLSDLGCIICSINSNSGQYDVEIGCDITFTEIKNNYSSIHSVTSSSYENVYTATFDIMKYNCSSDDIYMTSFEVRDIMRWLNRREYYKFRVLNDIADESNVHYYGSFNVKQIMLGEHILGLTLTFTSNAPYGFGDIIETKCMLLNAVDTASIYGDSDEFGTVYPKVNIRCLSSGNLEIKNKTTGNILKIDNCSVNEIITVDGEHKVIFTNTESHTTLPNDFNYEYLDILVDEYETENIYSSTLPCELTISYQPMRKIGVM